MTTFQLKFEGYTNNELNSIINDDMFMYETYCKKHKEYNEEVKQANLVNLKKQARQTLELAELISIDRFFELFELLGNINTKYNISK